MKNNSALQNNSIDRSYQMRILSVIGICFVIFGHINFPQADMQAIGTFYGWFPYYSFHLPIFLFITGYYFKDCGSGSGTLGYLGRFFRKKILGLLVPYFVINGLFLLTHTLLNGWGISYLKPFSFTQWLIHPWTRLYVVTYAAPTWYLISLFIAEVYYVLLRLVLRKLIRREFAMELTLLLLTLAMGITAVVFKSIGHPTETMDVYLRSVVMLFFIQVGAFYRKHLEKHDHLPSVPYLLILLLIQFLILLLSGDNDLSPGLYAMISFSELGYNYFLAGLTGVLLWLRIARILAGIPGRSRLILFIGNHTKYIMAFHVFGFFLLNSLLFCLHQHHLVPVLTKDFNTVTYHSYLYYSCTQNPRMIPLYFLAGLGVSLLFAWIIDLVSQKVRGKTKTLNRSISES